jgi:hypothetical protein
MTEHLHCAIFATCIHRLQDDKDALFLLRVKQLLQCFNLGQMLIGLVVSVFFFNILAYSIWIVLVQFNICIFWHSKIVSKRHLSNFDCGKISNDASQTSQPAGRERANQVQNGNALHGPHI